MSIENGYNKYEKYEKLANGNYKKVSYDTISESVHMTDGTDLQTKIDEIDEDVKANFDSLTESDSTIITNADIDEMFE